MRVLHAAAEVFPLVKTGGLADVLGALPQALIAAGTEVRLVLPGFPAILQGVEQLRLVAELGAMFGAARITLRLGSLARGGPPAYVIDAPYFYQRPGNPYQAANGAEWPDNLQRFALLGWVAAHLASGELDVDWRPDLLHVHDWHAALACAYMAAHPASAATVFTVHNLAYQGLFDASDYHTLGLPARFMVPRGLEFHRQVSFMKAGLTYASRVTTVSPRYAAEIATAEFGCGLEGVVRARGNDVSGILNGVDSAVWNPETDALIAAPYSSRSLVGKALCKSALQQSLGLKADSQAPLFAAVSRLTSQKGLDLILASLPVMLAQGAQLAIQGSGDPALESAFLAAAAAHVGQVAVRLGYDERFAHQMIAGADVMLVPSRFEPCGLTQLYALRYGTVPLVRRVGGLADTVIDHEGLEPGDERSTGFVFGPASADALAGALVRAMELFRQRAQWRALMARGMARDFSWASAADEYLTLYREVAHGHAAAT